MTTDMSVRQRGIALIAVLLLLVFILTIVGGLFYRHQIHIQKVTRSLVGEQAQLFLLSAESWAKSVLEDDARATGDVDHLGEIWARQLPVLPIEGGLISGCMMDLQSRINLNSLSEYSNRSWDIEINAGQAGNEQLTRRRLLKNLMVTLEMDDSDERLAALVDWLDADSWLVSPSSAEDNEYLLLDPPYRAANHSLTELSELSLVQGFSTEDVVKLAPWVNIISVDSAININTAPPTILMALSPSMSQSQAEVLAESRPFQTLPEFYTMLANVMGETQQTLEESIPSELLTVESSYFQLRANVEVAGIRLEYNSVIHRDSGARTAVLSRTLRYLPPVEEVNGSQVGADQRCQPVQEIET